MIGLFNHNSWNIRCHFWAAFMGCFVAAWSLPCPGYGQYENIWMFGHNAGVSFSAATPMPFWHPNKISNEACASVCDDNGQLLFYTNGTIVWNRNHNVMPNGQNITGIPTNSPLWINGNPPTFYTSQGALIVPRPHHPDQYYVFSLSPWARNHSKGQLYYSLIDMSLDRGLGDVHTNEKGILLDTFLSERMSATLGKNCSSIWVMTMTDTTFYNGGIHHDGADEVLFKAFEVTSLGVNVKPVVSPARLPVSSGKGQIAFAPNAKKMALSVYTAEFGFLFGPSSLAICDFDPNAGRVSNATLLDTVSHYGICFSPDNSKLYVNNNDDHAFYQYSFVDCRNDVFTKSILGYSPNPTYNGYSTHSIKRGDNGRIYIGVGIATQWLNTIKYPDNPASSCAYTPFDIDLTSAGITLKVGLPNNVVRAKSRDTLFHLAVDTTLCLADEGGLFIYRLAVAEAACPTQYLWNDGEKGAVRYIDQPGTYWVYTDDLCNPRIDTFIIKAENTYFSLGSDTVVCAPFTMRIEVPGASFLWNNGAGTPGITIRESGAYWLTAIKNGCSFSDTLQVSFIDLTQDLGDDIRVCKGEEIPAIPLSAATAGGAEVLWSTGSTADGIVTHDTGTYWVSVKHGPCWGTDTIRLSLEICDCHFKVPDPFSPNGDGLNDVFYPFIDNACFISHYFLNIYNRFGERIFSSTKPLNGWDGFYQGQPVDVGIYFYEFGFTGGDKRTSYYHKGDIAVVR